jgi:RNA polymerase sigma-70 factor (ECF subfamily)
MLSSVAIAHDRENVNDDLALVQAARADRNAFAPLYFRYRDQVYAYVRTRTDDTADAEDLTQQIFLRALDAFRATASVERLLSPGCSRSLATP